MTWRTAVSIVASVVLALHIWLIETLSVSLAAQLAIPWAISGTVIAVVATAIALPALIWTWRTPGLRPAISRISHVTVVIEFLWFIVRYYIHPWIYYGLMKRY